MTTSIQASELETKIANRTAVITVVGLGYVGLTAACILAEEGFSVTGIDIDGRKVRLVDDGIFPFAGHEPQLPEILEKVVQQGMLRATTSYVPVASSDVVLIVVQTPVDTATHQPDLIALHQATQAVGSYLRPGTLVIVESTIPPGTIRDIVVPWLEKRSGMSANSDFFVGCCPERVMPGKLVENLRTCNRVFGGWTPEAAHVGTALYRNITSGSVDPTDAITAELVKTTENAYRDVQIAFANEIGLLCEQYNADVYAVRELVNGTPFRAMHLPGAGVGGHCIPKDPWLLVANAGDVPLRLIPAARSINDGMPIHVGELAEAALAEEGRALSESTIVIAGYAYLPDTDDSRNSPSAALLDWLFDQGATIRIHDPHIAEYAGDLNTMVNGADAFILMVAHSAYRDVTTCSLATRLRTPILVDGRAFFDPADAHAAGLTYRCVGRGHATAATAKSCSLLERVG